MRLVAKSQAQRLDERCLAAIVLTDDHVEAGCERHAGRRPEALVVLDPEAGNVHGARKLGADRGVGQTRLHGVARRIAHRLEVHPGHARSGVSTRHRFAKPISGDAVAEPPHPGQHRCGGALEPRENAIMPIDPILAIVFALANTKGAYALLIGSGVSRAAGVPTGWEVVEDLIRRLAALSGERAEPDPGTWYAAQSGEPPQYDRLLAQVGATAAERRQLLRGYFEPTPDELERNVKVPTAAHRAVAQLIARGYVRVVLTTNFDRLLEQALQDAGVTPTVISTPEGVSGALPLPHEHALVVKLHGDYLDTRIKNVSEELERYDPAVDALIDRVLDEYGLVVCGWSAEWDAALRRAIERCPNHRFSTFWAVKGRLTPEAERLVSLRRAQLIPINGADAFFQDLIDKVRSLEEVERPHPLSKAVAVETLKRYLPEPAQHIRQHDLVMGEIEYLYGLVAAGRLGPAEGDTAPDFGRRLAAHEAAAGTAMALLATGAHWGDEGQWDLWVKALERLSNPPNADAWAGGWPSLRRYAAVLALYSAGLGAVAVDRRSLLGRLLFAPRVRVRGQTKCAVQVLHCGGRDDDVMPHGVAKRLPGLEHRKTPFSDRLFEALREPLRDLVPDDEEYGDTFDRFEYLLALAFIGLRLKEHPSAQIWGPPGRFSWRAQGTDFELFKRVEEEAKIPDGHGWLLRDGMFEVRLDRFLEVKGEFDRKVYEWMHTSA